MNRMDSKPVADDDTAEYHVQHMSTTADKIASQIKEMPDVEKLRLVDAILADLDKPDPEIDRIWADEARKRWAAYKDGRIATLSYEEVMAKHRSE